MLSYESFKRILKLVLIVACQTELYQTALMCNYFILYVILKHSQPINFKLGRCLLIFFSLRGYLTA